MGIHRARHLSPGLGVWLSMDPFEGVVGRPMSLNGYSWVEGQLPNAIDPTGRETQLQCYQTCVANPCYRNRNDPLFWVDEVFPRPDPYYIGDGYCPEISHQPYHGEFLRCMMRCDYFHTNRFDAYKQAPTFGDVAGGLLMALARELGGGCHPEALFLSTVAVGSRGGMFIPGWGWVGLGLLVGIYALHEGLTRGGSIALPYGDSSVPIDEDLHGIIERAITPPCVGQLGGGNCSDVARRILERVRESDKAGSSTTVVLWADGGELPPTDETNIRFDGTTVGWSNPPFATSFHIYVEFIRDGLSVVWDNAGVFVSSRIYQSLLTPNPPAWRHCREARNGLTPQTIKQLIDAVGELGWQARSPHRQASPAGTPCDPVV